MASGELSANVMGSAASEMYTASCRKTVDDGDLCHASPDMTKSFFHVQRV